MVVKFVTNDSITCSGPTLKDIHIASKYSDISVSNYFKKSDAPASSPKSR